MKYEREDDDDDDNDNYFAFLTTPVRLVIISNIWQKDSEIILIINAKTLSQIVKNITWNNFSSDLFTIITM